MNKIILRNISSATVVINMAEINFRRSLSSGRAIPITRDEYDNLTFDPGVQNMVRGGYIRFENVEEGKEIEVDSRVNIADRSEIEKMIAERNVPAFAKFIVNASPAAKETIVEYAVNNNVTDNAFTALIKQYCGVDVIDAISIKHKAEEK